MNLLRDYGSQVYTLIANATTLIGVVSSGGSNLGIVKIGANLVPTLAKLSSADVSPISILPNYLITSAGRAIALADLSYLPNHDNSSYKPAWLAGPTDDYITCTGITSGNYSFRRYSLSGSGFTETHSYSCKFNSNGYSPSPMFATVGDDIIAVFTGYYDATVRALYVVRLSPGTGNVVWAKRIFFAAANVPAHTGRMEWVDANTLAFITSTPNRPTSGNNAYTLYWLDVATGNLTSKWKRYWMYMGAARPVRMWGDVYYPTGHPNVVFNSTAGALGVNLDSPLSGYAAKIIQCGDPYSGNALMAADAVYGWDERAIFSADAAGFTSPACGVYTNAADSSVNTSSTNWSQANAVDTPAPIAASAPLAGSVVSNTYTMSALTISPTTLCDFSAAVDLEAIVAADSPIGAASIVATIPAPSCIVAGASPLGLIDMLSEISERRPHLYVVTAYLSGGQNGLADYPIPLQSFGLNKRSGQPSYYSISAPFTQELLDAFFARPDGKVHILRDGKPWESFNIGYPIRYDIGSRSASISVSGTRQVTLNSGSTLSIEPGHAIAEGLNASGELTLELVPGTFDPRPTDTLIWRGTSYTVVLKEFQAGEEMQTLSITAEPD